MRRIALAEAQVGDILAEPLTDEQGKMLLPKGARLSTAVLSLLRRRGISVLSVEGEDPLAGDIQQLLEKLEFRFAGLEDDPLMMQIKAIARGHLLRRH